jgi:lipoprotein-releasing system ATP-binding protein
MNNKLIIQGINLHRYFQEPTGKELRVLKGINLSVSQGELVSLIGPSGVGKTTLLHLIAGLDKPTQGKVYIQGVDLSKLKDKEIVRLRNKTLGLVFQFHHLLPEFTALENVALPALISGMRQSVAQRRARLILKEVGLEARAEHLPNELSGGERQRVAVARALINEPQVILADEPTGNLDREAKQNLAELFLNLNKKLGIAFLIATHDEALAQLAQRVLRIKDGQICSSANNN